MNMAEGIWKPLAEAVMPRVNKGVWERLKLKAQEEVLNESGRVNVVLSVEFVPHFRILEWTGDWRVE